MSLSGFYTDADRARAAANRQADAAESRARAAALRLKNEQTTWELLQVLPFRWLVGKARPKYQGPRVWEQAPAALHIQLQEPASFTVGRKAYSRAAGDWLCSASLDTDSGEVRYEPEVDPHQLLHSDGSGGPRALYYPAPTCKKCLALAAKALQLVAAAPHEPGPDGQS